VLRCKSQKALASRSKESQRGAEVLRCNNYVSNGVIFVFLYEYREMAYPCTYACGEKFSRKFTLDRHIKNFHVISTQESALIQSAILPKRPKISLKSSNPIDTTLKSQVNITGNVNKDSQLSHITDQLAQLTQVVAELRSSKVPIIENQTNHITINNTLVYNCFDQHTIDIFNRILERYGPDRAISYSGSLLKGKNKNNKHDWIRNPELVNLESLSNVIKYDSNPRNQGFHILGADNKEIIDTDGSIVDKILTNTVVNANLKAQSHLATKASEAADEGNSERMWEIWTDSSIYNQRGETIHDYIDKFKKVTASKSHLIDVINGS
jgi:hypothetical protein